MSEAYFVARRAELRGEDLERQVDTAYEVRDACPTAGSGCKCGCCRICDHPKHHRWHVGPAGRGVWVHRFRPRDAEEANRP